MSVVKRKEEEEKREKVSGQQHQRQQTQKQKKQKKLKKRKKRKKQKKQKKNKKTKKTNFKPFISTTVVVIGVSQVQCARQKKQGLLSIIISIACPFLTNDFLPQQY